MNIASSINFGLCALNIGVTVQAIQAGSPAWWINLGAAVFFFCMAITAMD
jgi:hypothetical protein